MDGEDNMNTTLKKLALYFSAGSLGGLTNSIALWLFGALGITTSLGVKLAPALSPEWLYPRIVWGGIWGIAFFLPLLRTSYFLRGLILSLGPTLVQLFIVFPYKANKGMLGLELGSLTPLFVIFFNAAWGITAAYLLKAVGNE